eukprot:TRINITY_DN19581_c0_g1_i1.p4 TRINITY_DN19581_c0_g1~~TRINITY_DN19581_c0_g1_i1.p4  ORF type:complete len:121 (+),score=5.90 TRINITY_DN19581_c0_g1_i1:3-365(+)
MTRRFQLATCLLAVVLSPAASAHGGGLNAEGCHVNRKTGDYHCHRKPAPAAVPDSSATAQGFAQLQPGLQGRTRRTGAFANCAEARAAGAAPVRIGEPGYGVHLDRDRDGIGCEPYHGRR